MSAEPLTHLSGAAPRPAASAHEIDAHLFTITFSLKTGVAAILGAFAAVMIGVIWDVLDDRSIGKLVVTMITLLVGSLFLLGLQTMAGAPLLSAPIPYKALSGILTALVLVILLLVWANLSFSHLQTAHRIAATLAVSWFVGFVGLILLR